MFKKADRKASRKRRHLRVRKKVFGTPERPRLSIYRSEKNIYAQIIDDINAVTLVAASSLEKDFSAKGGNKEGAKLVGGLVAKKAIDRGITEVVFDRGGFIYHGRIKVVNINRVTKVVKGGRNFRFAALVVVGDENGHVGVGMGKSIEIPEAIKKGIEDAKKNLVEISTVSTTIPHEIHGKFGTSDVLIMPAKEGTGVIAGGPARIVLELAGIKDVRAKSLGSNNPNNMVKATINGLANLRTAEQIAKLRGKSVEEILG